MITSDLFLYLAKVSLISAVLYILFTVFFHKISFNGLNRAFLLFIITFSFLCPFLEFDYIPSADPINLDMLIANNYEFQGTEIRDINEARKSSGITYINILFFVYLTGCVLFLSRFIIQLAQIIKLRRLALFTEREKLLIINSDKIKVPFSFFNWIFLPVKYYQNQNEKESIICHEMTHAKQLHSLDLILCEFFIVFLWFNPVGYLLKRSIKTIHEYQADSIVIKSLGSLPQYLRLLIKEKQKQVLPNLCHPFSNLSLKKRIIMMTKPESPRYKKLRYLLIIPTITFILFAFSGKGNINKNIPDMMPLQSEDVKISSGYGMRIHPIYNVEKMHYGIDLVAPLGTPVLATADGRVIKKEFDEEGKGYGRLVLIQHNEVYSTLYTQLSVFNVEVGDQIKRGDVVGYVGASGIGTGPHLHYEVHKNGERVNPADYFGK